MTAAPAGQNGNIQRPQLLLEQQLQPRNIDSGKIPHHHSAHLPKLARLAQMGEQAVDPV